MDLGLKKEKPGNAYIALFRWKAINTAYNTRYTKAKSLTSYSI